MSTSLLLTMRVMLCALGLRERANPEQRANGPLERAGGLQLGYREESGVSRLPRLCCGNGALVSGMAAAEMERESSLSVAEQ